jgi:hypothetical protein
VGSDGFVTAVEVCGKGGNFTVVFLFKLGSRVGRLV